MFVLNIGWVQQKQSHWYVDHCYNRAETIQNFTPTPDSGYCWIAVVGIYTNN